MYGIDSPSSELDPVLPAGRGLDRHVQHHRVGGEPVLVALVRQLGKAYRCSLTVTGKRVRVDGRAVDYEVDPASDGSGSARYQCE